ncbi:MAG: anti-sigma factor [Vicingaceae bacterium]
MEPKAYIESGILEQYVLGQLSASEAAEVESMCKKNPEVAKEVEEISNSFEAYANAHAKKPSASVKANILAEITEAPSVEEFEGQEKSGHFARIIAIAASLLLLISIGMNLYQQSQLQEKDQKIEALYAEQEVMAEAKDQMKTNLKEAKTKLDLYRNPKMQRIEIKGSDLSPESYAFVHWDKQTNKAFLSNVNLPQPSKELQYQLWAIVDGKPIDLGVFDLDQTEIEIDKAIENPSAFAVTLEERGGKPTPNLKQLYLIGNV